MSGRTGKITDIEGNEWEFTPIQETTYGEAGGLFGINCRHTFRYIEDGLFANNQEQVDSVEKLKENAKEYAQSQEQRQIEREIRNNKRTAELLRGIGDKEGASIYDSAVKAGRAEYREFCKETGRTERWERTLIF